MTTENTNETADHGAEEETYNSPEDVLDDETQEEWVPPTQEEFNKLVADKRKATDEAIKRKRLLREHGIDLATGKRADASESDSDVGDKVSKTEMQTALGQVKAKERRLGIEVPAALEEADWNGRGLARIYKLLDLDAVTVDEDGTVGLTEQIGELKVDFPEFFKRSRTSPPAGAAGMGPKQSESDGSGHWADKFRRNMYGSGS